MSRGADVRRGGELEGDATPLPAPLPHHVAEPTKTSVEELEEPTDADPREPPPLPAVDDDAPVSASHQELTGEFDRTFPGAERGGRDSDDELTVPREVPLGLDVPPAGRTAVEDSRLIALIPPAARGEVLARFERRSAARGTVVVRIGEVGHALILVARGRLAIRGTAEDGSVIVLGHVRDGELVGEGSLLARTPSPVQVVAIEDSELLALAPADAYDLARQVPAVWAELKQSAERRAREWSR